MHNMDKQVTKEVVFLELYIKKKNDWEGVVH